MYSKAISRIIGLNIRRAIKSIRILHYILFSLFIIEKEKKIQSIDITRVSHVKRKIPDSIISCE